MELGGKYETVGKGLLIIGTAGAGFTQIARGLASVATRTGAGVYAMTLAEPVPPTTAVVTAAIISGAAGSAINVIPDGTGTVWTINTNAAGGAAADVNFSVTIEQLAGV